VITVNLSPDTVIVTDTADRILLASKIRIYLLKNMATPKLKLMWGKQRIKTKLTLRTILDSSK